MSDDTSIVAEDLGEEGVRALIMIDGPKAASTYEFPIGVPEGGGLAESDDGSIEIVGANGNTAAVVTTPWATDANGEPVPTSFELKGNMLIQHVDHSNAAYPVTADPAIDWDCQNINCTIRLDRQRTQLVSQASTADALETLICVGAGPASAPCRVVVGRILPQTIADRAKQFYDEGGCLALRVPIYGVSKVEQGEFNCEPDPVTPPPPTTTTTRPISTTTTTRPPGTTNTTRPATTTTSRPVTTPTGTAPPTTTPTTAPPNTPSTFWPIELPPYTPLPPAPSLPEQTVDDFVDVFEPELDLSPAETQTVEDVLNSDPALAERATLNLARIKFPPFPPGETEPLERVLKKIGEEAGKTAPRVRSTGVRLIPKIAGRVVVVIAIVDIAYVAAQRIEESRRIEAVMERIQEEIRADPTLVANPEDFENREYVRVMAASCIELNKKINTFDLFGQSRCEFLPLYFPSTGDLPFPATLRSQAIYQVNPHWFVQERKRPPSGRGWYRETVNGSRVANVDWPEGPTDKAKLGCRQSAKPQTGEWQCDEFPNAAMKAGGGPKASRRDDKKNQPALGWSPADQNEAEGRDHLNTDFYVRCPIVDGEAFLVVPLTGIKPTPDDWGPFVAPKTFSICRLQIAPGPFVSPTVSPVAEPVLV